MASSFRMYGKLLSYSILWGERQGRYLSVSFHGRKLQKSSQPNDFSISAERFFVLSRLKWSMAERWLKYLSACNLNIMNALVLELKDEGAFANPSVGGGPYQYWQQCFLPAILWNGFLGKRLSPFSKSGVCYVLLSFPSSRRHIRPTLGLPYSWMSLIWMWLAGEEWIVYGVVVLM